MWPEYLGKFTFMGETRNQAPIYVKAVPNTWMERMNPPTLSREQDGKWYVQSPWETENGGTIFRCKTILFLSINTSDAMYRKNRESLFIQQFDLKRKGMNGKS